MKKFFSANIVSHSLVISGSIFIFLSLVADLFGIGGETRTFGYKQATVVIFGFLLFILGIIMLWKTSGSGLIKLVKEYYSTVAIYLATALGLFWLLYIFKAGIRFSPDSVSYQTFALKMHYMADFDVGATWPPLYPILIHLAMYFQKFPAEAAAIVSGLSMFGGLVFFTLILCKYSRNSALIFLILANLFFWDKYINIYTAAWSEAPFTFVLVLALYYVIAHHDKQRTRDYIFAAVVVALAPFIRYVGVVLIALFLGYTLYHIVIAFWVSKTFTIVKYLVLSSIAYIPIAFYFYKNLRTTGTLTGARVAANLTIFETMNSTLDVLLKDINIYLRILILISIIIYVLMILNHKRFKGIGNTLFPSSFILIFFTFYCAFIAYMTAQSKVDPINTRYFSPLYPYILIFTFISIETMASSKFPELIDFGNIQLLKIGIFSLLSISLIINIVGFNSWMNNISKKRFFESAHTEAGFNLSPSSFKLNEYFTEILNKEKQIDVVVIMDTQATYNQYFGPDMFYRKGIINSSKTSEYTFENFKQDKNYYNLFKDFTLSLKMGGIRKYINIHKAPRLSNDQQMANFLIQITEEHNIDNIFLVVYTKNLPLMGGDTLSPRIEEEFDIDSLESIDPYKVYQLSRSN